MKRLHLAALIALAACEARGPGDGDADAERRGKARHDAATMAALAALALPNGPGTPSTPRPPPPLGGGLNLGFTTPRLFSPLIDWEPAIAVSRDGRFVVQATTHYNDPNSTAQPPVVMRISWDCGTNWSQILYVEDHGPWEADPQVVIADDDTCFVLWINDFNPGMKIIKSTDHGQTWSAPVEVAPPSKPGRPPWNDKPWLAVAPGAQDVYVGFNSSDAYSVASHDGGATWQRPIKTNNDTRYWYHSGGCVAPNGHVFFATADYRQTNLGPVNVGIVRSIDKGKTWTNKRVDTSQEVSDCTWSSGCYQGFLGPAPSIACDQNGTLCFAYTKNTVARTPLATYIVTSTDDGKTWSPALRVSDPSNTPNCGFPQIAAGPFAGDFRLVYQDDRAGFGEWNTWYQSTSDGGLNWGGARRLSDGWPGVPYQSPIGYAFVFGDYFGFAVDGFGTCHVLWGEGASYDGPGGCWYSQGF